MHLSILGKRCRNQSANQLTAHHLQPCVNSKIHANKSFTSCKLFYFSRLRRVSLKCQVARCSISADEDIISGNSEGSIFSGGEDPTIGLAIHGLRPKCGGNKINVGAFQTLQAITQVEATRTNSESKLTSLGRKTPQASS